MCLVPVSYTHLDRINRRVDIMIKSGLLEEVKGLMDMGYTKELNSMKGIGYKEIMDYYDGKMSLEDAVELIKQSSRRYEMCIRDR